MKKCLIFIFISFALMYSFTISIFAKTSETITIIAGSDYQNPDGHKSAEKEVSDILSAIKNDGIYTADAFLFCGDYDYDTYGNNDAVKAGIKSLKNCIDQFVTDEIILAQGNHDSPSATNGMSPSGNNDPQSGGFGVFVINNDDYMWKNNDLTAINSTAHLLNDYLSAKKEANFYKPIFIVSHLPLHYSMRTKNDGDCMYADRIFNIINNYAENGLNIVFLYGHDHSNGWDDYLGGSCVFLTKGDNILIAQSSKDTFKEETLHFAYMNAGYVGYYSNHNGADDTLTMTVFHITNNHLIISRYSKNGLHLLKSAGVTNSFKEETAYFPNKTQYLSKHKIKLYEPVNQLNKTDTQEEKTSPEPKTKESNTFAKYSVILIIILFVAVSIKKFISKKQQLQ